MEIDKNAFSKLKAMSDEEFKAVVENIAGQLKLPSHYVDMITKNSEKVKKKMGNISSAELNRLASKIGEEKLRAIMEEIERK